MTQWDDLNKRQQEYLKAVFDLDQSLEISMKQASASGDWNVPRASVWRWIPYNASYSSLLQKITDLGYRDRGTGSTFEALERRGLVECRYERAAIRGSILYVQITKVGRKLVRDTFNLSAPKALPPGTLRAWHWRALAYAYQVGEAGIEAWPRGIGDMTVRRLKEYRVKGQDRPLIGWVEWPCEPYLRRRWPGDTGVPSTVRDVLTITPFGRQYYQENWQRYQDLYPTVQAPAPEKEM